MRHKLFTLLFAILAGYGTIYADFVQSVIGPTQTITYHFYTESRTAEVVGFAMVTGSVVIPEQILWADIYYTVTGIGEDAFRNCTNLTSITMPDLVERIGNYAFAGCSNLTGITFPFNRLQSIGNYAFYGCTGLISITIPNSVTSIGEWAFAECSSLASVRIGNSVTTIGDCAFAYSRLTSVTIPNSVTTIGEHAFLFCTVTSINFIGSMKDWCYKLWNPGQLFTDVDGYRLYINGVLQENIDIPNNVTSIGDNAFEYCIGLTSVAIPNSVTSIGSAAFRNCSSLTSITIPNSVTSIGSGAFYDCTSLTSISIPNSVTSIGEHAFDYCSGLTSIVVENGNTTYDSRNNCNAIIETFTNTLIAGCMNTIIPNSVTSIGSGAFLDCSSLTSISIPNSVTSIGDWAFAWCSSLDSLVFESKTPATLGKEVFTYTNNCPLIVPCSAVDAYKTAWPTYANRITCSGITLNTYTIRFLNWNGDLLSEETLLENTLPQYLGPTPAREEDEQYRYSFIGWTPEIVPVTEDAVYTATYRAIELGPITVRLDPQSCADWSVVRLWAWTSSGNLFDAWPGIVVNQDADGWFSYTFDESVESVNIIWTDGTNQTVNIEGVTESTCYALNATLGKTIMVSTEQCPGSTPTDIEITGSAESPVSKILRNGQIYILRGDKTYTVTGQEVK